MPQYISPQQKYGHLWHAEAQRYWFDYDDWDTALCAELADELWHHGVAAGEDPDFPDEMEHWNDFIMEAEIFLPLEQSCHQGVLLPTGQRARRLETCPEEMLKPLRRFFESCPRHVKSYLSLYHSVLVRIDRARRTGNPDWRPQNALPAPEAHAFFRPPKLVVRNYAR